MLEPILSGIGFGIILSAMLGPVFFTLLQTSLHEGFKAGSHLAFGVLLSDAFWVVVDYIFAATFDLSGHYKTAMSWTGGLLLIFFGLSMLFQKIKAREVDDNKKTVHAKFVLKGFFLNTFNPAVPVFWLSMIGVAKLKQEYTLIHEGVFFGTILFTAFFVDLIKAFISHRLKKLLTAEVVHWINKIIGAVLICIGASMLLKA